MPFRMAALTVIGEYWRFAVGVAIAAGALAAAEVKFSAFDKIPGTLARHDSTTVEQTKVLNKMLCLQVADHRRLDWHLCYLDPKLVVPNVN